MPNITPLQDSFSKGELSPRLYARSELDAYRQGLRILENFIPDSRGSAKTRVGFRFLQKADEAPAP